MWMLLINRIKYCACIWNTIQPIQTSFIHPSRTYQQNSCFWCLFTQSPLSYPPHFHSMCRQLDLTLLQTAEFRLVDFFRSPVFLLMLLQMLLLGFLEDLKAVCRCIPDNEWEGGTLHQQLQRDPGISRDWPPIPIPGFLKIKSEYCLGFWHCTQDNVFRRVFRQL